VPIMPITRSMTKRIKKTFNEIIQDIWVNSSFQTLTRDDQTLINVNPNKKRSWWSDNDKERWFGLGFLMFYRFLKELDNFKLVLAFIFSNA
jgi:hypothetical protein